MSQVQRQRRALTRCIVLPPSESLAKEHHCGVAVRSCRCRIGTGPHWGARLRLPSQDVLTASLTTRCPVQFMGQVVSREGVDSNMPEPEESEAVKNRLRPAPLHRSQLSRAGSALARLRTRCTRVRSDALVGAKECARVILLVCRAGPQTPCGCLPKKLGPPSGMSWLRAWWLALYASSSSIL